MKISELIETLDLIRRKYGDLPTKLLVGYGEAKPTVGAVRAEQSGKEYAMIFHVEVDDDD